MSLLLLDPRPDDAAADRPATAAERPSPVVHRVRLLAVCLGFAGLCLTQQPGRIAPDTKLDLTVDPLVFLGRALQLWEPEGFSGQLQNQAYGYLFPMGPFFALGQAAGLPVWVVQRLWWVLLLSVAFLGVVRVAGRLNIGTPMARIVAGVAYALSPRMVTSLGAVSIEVLPMAVAPWVLLALVSGSRGGSPRRAGALAGLAVLCAGGVNAAAAATVLPLGVIWLLTRAPGPRRRRLIAWWAGCTALATLWWVGPLLLLGRYSPPFLDYIETAAVTTAPGELAQALRGTTQWVPALGSGAGSVWPPAGVALRVDTLPVLASALLAAVGLFALTRADLPHRRFLVLGALTGLTMVTAGHVAEVSGLLAAPIQEALDGALAPLRNVHKFEPVLRLPLVLGLAHVLAVALRRATRGRPAAPPGTPPGDSDPPVRTGGRDWRARGVSALVVLAVVGAASPALDGELAAPSSWAEVPGYWEQTADTLAQLDPNGRAMLVPGSSFGVYLWGSPADEPLQPLAQAPWTARTAVPLTPAGYIRMLDVVEERLARGSGGPGLTEFLARNGISHLVVRNDLDTGAAGATRSVLVRRALADSPGLTRVVGFGPDLFTVTALPGLVLDGGAVSPVQAVEIYAVAGAAPRAALTPLSGVVGVLGGPDGVAALTDRPGLGDAPTLAAADLPGAGPADPAEPAGRTGADRLPDGTPGVVVTDALVRRERTFGRLADSTSAALAPDDPLRLPASTRDYLLPDQAGEETAVRYVEAAPAASSSASDPDSIGGSRVEHHPFAALDGDPSTSWQPAPLLLRRSEWWQMTLVDPVEADAVTVRLDPGTLDDTPSRVRVRTDAGESTVPLERTAEPQRLALPAGPTRTLTITADPAPGSVLGPRLGLAEVELPGVAPRRTLVTPVPTGPVAAYAFDTEPARGGCVTLVPVGPVRCLAALARGAEEPVGLDRTFTVADPAAYDVSATAVPRPGPALDALLTPQASGDDDPRTATATATSASVPDPRGGAGAAFDGDPTTVWVADPADNRPAFTLTWSEPSTVDRLRIVAPPGGAAAAVPTAITVSGDGQERTVALEADGTARFFPITSAQLTIRFPITVDLGSYDPYTRALTPLGVGVAEVEVPGLVTPDLDRVVELPCGQGPQLRVDGRVTPTALRATVADLRALRPVALRPCEPAGPAPLAAGEHSFTAPATDAFTVVSATLTREDGPPAGVVSQALPTPVWDVEYRTAVLPGRDAPALLSVPENVNRGWVATLDGVVLEPRTVDGWQQGYLVPAGPAGTVELTFTPGPLYRGVLLAGAVGVLVVLVLLVVPVRRGARGAALEPCRPNRGRVSVVVAAVVGTALVAGPVGLAALGMFAYVTGPAGVRRRPLLGWVAFGAAGACGLLLLVAASFPFGSVPPAWLAEPGRQVLGAVAVAAVVAALLPVPVGVRPERVRSGTRLRYRFISGRSSSR